MQKTFSKFFSTAAVLMIIALSFFPLSSINAHALLPDEVIEFIENTPNVTDEAIEKFFQDTYGYGIEEFWENNPDPADEFMEPSEEFLEMQANGEIPEEFYSTRESENAINNVTSQILEQNQEYQSLSDESKQAFLQQAMKLKFQGNEITLWEKIKTYIPIGIAHILEGTDHILFVLSLLLIATNIRRLLIFVSIFTVAHSITLLLAGMNIITLSSSIVEPIIALSILYTAISSIIENRTTYTQRFSVNAIIVFIFGLFHGLGFAGSFADLQIDGSNFFSALLALNIGVEIGQLFIIVLAFPIFWMIRTQKGGKTVIDIFALIISLVAIYWVWERVLG